MDVEECEIRRRREVSLARRLSEYDFAAGDAHGLFRDLGDGVLIGVHRLKREEVPCGVQLEESPVEAFPDLFGHGPRVVADRRFDQPRLVMTVEDLDLG